MALGLFALRWDSNPAELSSSRVLYAIAVANNPDEAKLLVRKTIGSAKEAKFNECTFLGLASPEISIQGIRLLYFFS